MRRFATIAASLALMLGLSAVGQLFAQDPKKDEKKAEAPKVEAKKDEPKKEEPKKEAAPKKEEAPKAAEPPIPAIPPEVEAKLEAARKAVAEAIVAAQDAGLVETTIEPPPILDLLVTGRALDARDVKARRGVSVEVFGAWFTGFNKAVEGVTAQENIRIVKPSQGLTDFYGQRANVFNRHIEAARKAKDAAKPKAEPKKEEPKKEEPKKPEAKKEEPKKEEAKKPEAKKEEPKKEEAKKPEAKKEEPKKDAPKSK